MSEFAQISEFGKILVFIITGFVLVALTLFLGRLLAPNKPTREKLTSYECGEEPTGSAWLPFNSRFYVIALVFLLFDVEMVFIFPWATVFGNKKLMAADARWGTFSLIEMFIFMAILIFGLIYVWRKGDLNWIKPEPEVSRTNVAVPASMYDKFNERQKNFAIKAFTLETKAEPAPLATVASADAPAATAKRPMFKPTFKKPGNES